MLRLGWEIIAFLGRSIASGVAGFRVYEFRDELWYIIWRLLHSLAERYSRAMTHHYVLLFNFNLAHCYGE